MKTNRLSWTALSLACLVPFLSAAPQDTGTKAGEQKVNRAAQEYKRLTTKVMLAQRAYYAKQRAEAKKAREEGQPMKAMSMRMDLSAFTGEALAGAKKYAGTDEALRFLVYALQIGKDKKVLVQLSETILTDHIKSDRLANYVVRLGRMGPKLGAEQQKTMMDAIKDSPSKAVQGAFHYQKGSSALRARGATAEAKEAALTEVRLALKLAPNAAFAKRAAGILYEAENLAIGMKSPDISGKDTDGVAFKLSDYKGKVILLDFWGDW